MSGMGQSVTYSDCNEGLLVAKLQTFGYPVQSLSEFARIARLSSVVTRGVTRKKIGRAAADTKELQNPCRLRV
jgi:hypothetical protein